MSPSSGQSRRLSKSKRRELRRQQTRKARAAKRRIQQHLSVLPDSVRSLLAFFSPAFTRPTLCRFALLALAVVLTLGCRTVSNLLRTLGPLAPGDPSSFHKVFSHRLWHPWRLSRLLLTWILLRFVPAGPVHLVADDTVTEHPGDKVHGKACHRDAVRSSHSFTAFRWGHKWLVLAIQVRLPGFNRPWPLPFCVALCHSEKEDKKHNRRHKTPAGVLAQMLLVVRRWFPERTFIVAADGGFTSHELARRCQKAKQIRLVSRFSPNAGLYEPPPVVKLNARGKKPNGRPRVKGKKRETPEQVVARTAKSNGQRLCVGWYGGGERLVEVVQGRAHWFKSGHGLVEVSHHELWFTHRG